MPIEPCLEIGHQPRRLPYLHHSQVLGVVVELQLEGWFSNFLYSHREKDLDREKDLALSKKKMDFLADPKQEMGTSQLKE